MRLGKQRVETKQIYLALTDPTYGWQHHPAVTMWRGCEMALAVYGAIICTEWRKRGYKDSLLPWFDARIPCEGSFLWDRWDWWPSWSWDDDHPIFLSHQSNLVRKDPAYYGPIFPGVPNNLPYVWPKNEF